MFALFHNTMFGYEEMEGKKGEGKAVIWIPTWEGRETGEGNWFEELRHISSKTNPFNIRKIWKKTC